MSDNLENFIRNHRDKFDSQVPNNQVWTNIQAGVAQHAATTAATASAAGAAKSGLAKIALGWKITAAVALTAIIGTGIFFATRPGDSKSDGKLPENMANVAPVNASSETTNQAEYLYAGSEVVRPPFEGIDVPYLTFKIDANQGGSWTAPTGTVLDLEGGIFVDAQGNPITGDVEIRYREFHDAEDVIVSGITMQYKENGAHEDFQTAGMMEILGYQNGKPVFIKPGKEVAVKMASFVKEDNYNLYFLDTKDGWKDIGKAKLSKNTEKEEGLRLLATKPRQPVKGSAQEMDGEVMFNANYDKFPELKPFKGVRWMAEVPATYKSLEDKIITKTWSDVELEELDNEGLRYRITLKHKYSASISIDVKPILEGEDYEKGMKRFKDKMDKYNKILAEKGLEESRLATQADVFRSFGVSGFGVFNCDRFYRGNNVTSVNAEYIFPEDVYMKAENTVIYQISGSNRGVLTLMPGERQILKFDAYDDNYLVAVLPGNTVAVFGPKQFAKIRNVKSAKIEMQKAEGQVLSAADLRKVIGV